MINDYLELFLARLVENLRINNVNLLDHLSGMFLVPRFLGLVKFPIGGEVPLF